MTLKSALVQEQSASQPITLRAIRVTGHPDTEFKY